MRIGIDIDGVITNLERFQLDYGTRFCNKTGIGKLISQNSYETIDIFGWTKDEDDMFWKEYLEFYSKEEPPRPFAAEVINKLKEENEIYIITARNDNGWNIKLVDGMQEIVKKWLQKHNIKYDKLIFSPEDKLEICIENKIECMIEDRSANVMEISTKIPVICFDNSYNRQCKGKNIIRCCTWYDIYDKIQDIT